jgi:hypothetical protein
MVSGCHPAEKKKRVTLIDFHDLKTIVDGYWRRRLRKSGFS